jgi:octaprenyl-diphosphate synthase
MQAFKVALEEKNLRVLDLLIGLTQQMVEGELLQIQKLGKAVSEAEYYDLIFRKTACLFAVSMRLGAVLAGPARPRRRTWPPMAGPWVWPSRLWTTCST